MSYLRYSLFKPQATFLEANGFAKVATIPCIFDEHWNYNRIASRYLRQRAKGMVDTGFAWALYRPTNLEARGIHELGPIPKQQSGRVARARPTKKSLAQMAYNLVNFLEWCEWRAAKPKRGRPKKIKAELDTAHLAWYDISYDDLLEGYQQHMVSGEWGTRPLSPSTVNSRADEACFFLHWAEEMGFRGPFDLETTTYKQLDSGLRSDSHKPQLSVTRKGRVRANPADLRMPSSEAVSNWLGHVQLEKGKTKSLMCRLILETGIRREECVQWRVWTLPKHEKDWVLSSDKSSVIVKLEYGAKGQDFLNSRGDIVGPMRQIEVPLTLAREIAAYHEFSRLRARAKYVKSAKTADEKKRRSTEQEDRLFLSEYTGLPISAERLYDAWTRVSSKPFTEWSPHLGRHYWACMKLLSLRKLALAIIKHKHEKVHIPASWIHNAAKSDIDLFIRPQLGHVDKKTTEKYLKWLIGVIQAELRNDDWIDHLESPV